VQWVLSISTLGIVPGVWLSGYVLLSLLIRGTKLPLARLTAWSLAPAVAIPAWSLAMAMSAYWGLFHAATWGAIGWIACVPLAPLAWSGRRLGFRQSLSKRIVLGAILLAAAVLYAAFPHDSFFVGRDQATYANQALHIARSGELTLPWPVTITDPQLRADVGNGSYSATGIYVKATHLQVQFSPVLPLWLAMAFSALGIVGLQGFNAVLAVLAGAVFFGVASRLTSRRVALAATALFTLNPLQIWVSRITLSEILAQYLVLSGVLLMLAARGCNRVRLWVLGGTVLGASVLVRIDGFVLAPLVVAFAWAAASVHRDATLRNRRASAGGVLGVLGALALGVPFYLLTTETYTLVQAKKLLPILGLTAVLAIVWWRRLGASLFGRVVQSRIFRIGGPVVLGSLGVFAYFVRPRWGPFSYTTNPSSVLYGTRNFREDSFVNLGIYVTPVLAFAALAGFWLLLQQALQRRTRDASLLFLFVWGGYTLLYLYNPSISPDHPWTMRRFVPVIIPGVVLLGSTVLDRARAVPLLSRWFVPLSAVVTAALLAYPTYRMRAGLFLREYGGAYAFVSSIADAVPAGALLLSDASARVFGHLALGRELRTIRTSFKDAKRFDAAQAVVAQTLRDDEAYYILTDKPHRVAGDKPIRAFEHKFAWLEETTTPPPQEIRRATFRLYLFERRGALQEPWKYLADLGLAPLSGVREGGFWPVEDANGRKSRWTQGEAWLDVPIEKGWAPRTLGVDIVGLSPKGTWLTVRANGHEIFNQMLDTAPAQLVLNLPNNVRKRLKLEFVSDTFRPSDGGGSNDQRELGIRLEALTLR